MIIILRLIMIIIKIIKENINHSKNNNDHKIIILK